MAGIEITTPVPNSNIYLVSHINQNSPASKVDIKKNDQIVRINGVRADEYNVNQIYRLFRSRQGKKVKLELRRNGDVLNQWTVTIVLKNAI